MAQIRNLQDELTTLCARGNSILSANNDALDTLVGRLSPLESAAPHVHQGTWQKVIKPFKDFLGQITGTWQAFKDYYDHPGWATLGKLTEDLAVDASVVVLAAGAPEALAGLGFLDAGVESATLAVAETTGAAARGVSVAATGLNVTSAEFRGDYGTGALAALALLAPGAKEAFGTSELDKTIGEAKIVATYKTARDGGQSVDTALSGLTADEQVALKAAVPKYGNPAAVTAATQRIATELQAVRKNVGLIDAPKGFCGRTACSSRRSRRPARGSTRPPAPRRAARAGREEGMSTFKVNSHSLRALQQAVLGVAVELENGGQSMMPYGYSSRPDPSTNYMTTIDSYGELNAGDEALGTFFSAWEAALAVIGKNIEGLSKQLGDAADEYERAEQSTASLTQLLLGPLLPQPPAPSGPLPFLPGMITGGG